MSSYTITITPDDTSRASTTLRVDVSDNTPRITELLVRAGTATGLSAQQLPAVDLDLLLRAVTPAAVPALIQTAEPDTAPPPVVSEAAETPSATETPAPPATAPAPVAAASTGRRTGTATAPPRKRAARKQAEAKAGGTTRSTATRAAKEPRGAKKATKSARTANGASTAAAGTDRAYRRAPDDLPQAFQQAGGVTAVARHYGVPRHTAQSWVRRLRQQGVIPAGR